ncbi:hypothetical protein B6I21_05455 [candidate division KSB1 bacterium 4572_119]|nr:MAG: hypothetical protein B6I21_05455 [candidate division KSB1 bacterium 4572_119]
MKHFSLYWILLAIILIATPLFSQENRPVTPAPLEHQKKMFMSQDKKVYLPGRDTPLYLRLASSDDEAASTFLLYNEESQQKLQKTPDDLAALPFFMEGPGRHSVIHPNAELWKKNPQPIDAILTPDRIFYIYVDEEKPTSGISVSQAPKHKSSDGMIYGSSVELSLNSDDKNSGVDNIYYSLNEEKYTKYESSIPVADEALYRLRYYSVDNVGNVESPNEFLFSIDLTPPNSDHFVKNHHKGNILSPEASFELKSSDSRSGVEKIYYQIDSQPEGVYNGKAILLSSLSDGDHQFTYFAEDKVKNLETKKIYSFYLDKTAPDVEMNVIGDQYENNKTLYVSGRTEIEISAVDNKSSVDRINYSINGSGENNYESPFCLPKENGNHTVSYSAVDEVRNNSSKRSLNFVLDLDSPQSKCRFDGAKIRVQDTLFISKTTNIKLAADDNLSEVRKINYQLDEVQMAAYSEPITVSEHGFHKISYFAVDNVENKESLNHVEFSVDTKPPELFYHFSISTSHSISASSEGENVSIYPPGTSLYLGATDQSSGVDKIYYTVNNGKKKVYTSLPPFMKSGDYIVEIEAIDQVGNLQTKMLNFVIRDITKKEKTLASK